ncbi:hypothetical protein PUN28_013203 [Cardiocondyla obscurior]|uniref:Uncharacterized protein n=1 Tax=Cardiocondyla obscurior TaxID=286306 RepID=A0AAW2F9G6_9HYME
MWDRVQINQIRSNVFRFPMGILVAIHYLSDAVFLYHRALQPSYNLLRALSLNRDEDKDRMLDRERKRKRILFSHFLRENPPSHVSLPPPSLSLSKKKKKDRVVKSSSHVGVNITDNDSENGAEFSQRAG